MNEKRKKTAGILLIVLISYLAGLFLFIPSSFIEPRLAAMAGNRLGWHHCVVRWGRITLQDVRIAGLPTLKITKVIIIPSLLPLLGGRLKASLLATAPFGHLTITAEKHPTPDNDHFWAITFSGDITSLDLLPGLSSLLPRQSEPSPSGTAHFSGNMRFENNALSDFSASTQITGFTGFGLYLNPITAMATRQNSGAIAIKVQASGDLAADGQIILSPHYQALSQSPLAGAIEVRLASPGPDSLAPSFFPPDTPGRLTFSGTLGSPQVSL